MKICSINIHLSYLIDIIECFMLNWIHKKYYWWEEIVRYPVLEALGQILKWSNWMGLQTSTPSGLQLRKVFCIWSQILSQLWHAMQFSETYSVYYAFPFCSFSPVNIIMSLWSGQNLTVVAVYRKILRQWISYGFLPSQWFCILIDMNFGDTLILLDVCSPQLITSVM